MKTLLKRTILLLAVFVMFSCGGVSNQAATAAGFAKIEKEIKAKFGENASYTNLMIVYNESLGNMITLTVTENPESLKMEEWGLINNSWNQISDITLEVPEGTQAKDFMFVLNDKINFEKLGALVEQSVEKLQDEKGIEKPILSTAYINFPKDGDINKATYIIELKPEKGAITFRFAYQINGEFVKMDE